MHCNNRNYIEKLLDKTPENFPPQSHIFSKLFLFFRKLIIIHKIHKRFLFKNPHFLKKIFLKRLGSRANNLFDSAYLQFLEPSNGHPRIDPKRRKGARLFPETCRKHSRARARARGALEESSV